MTGHPTPDFARHAAHSPFPRSPLCRASRARSARPAALLLGACAALALGGVQAADSGTAKTIQGTVLVERDGAALPLRVGDPVREKDRIVVPADGSAGITLRDDTRISVGPRSTLLINSFAFDAQTQEGNVDTSILRGTMRYVTGLVGRLRPSAVRVATSTATIGIRGTEFIVEVADAP